MGRLFLAFVLLSACKREDLPDKPVDSTSGSSDTVVDTDLLGPAGDTDRPADTDVTVDTDPVAHTQDSDVVDHGFIDTDPPANMPPRLEVDPVLTEEDRPVSVELAPEDDDGDPLTLEIGEPPAHGELVLVGTTLTYTPTPDWHGSVTASVVVDDGLARAEATVSIEVAPVNDPPEVSAADVITPRGQPVPVVLDITDPDGDVVRLSVLAPPEHGTLEPISAMGLDPLTFTPALDFVGTDRFTLLGVDPAGADDSVTVTVTVEPGSSPPVAPGVSYSTHAGIELQVDAREGVLREAYDPDGGAVQAVPGTLVSDQGVTVTLLADGSFVYDTPVDARDLRDAFTFSVVDLDLSTTPSTVEIHAQRRVWFVDNTHGSGGDGSSAAPYDDLASAEAASMPGDIVVVRGGPSADELDHDLTLQDGQVLCGTGIDCIIDDVLVEAASTAPRLEGTVYLASDTVVQGLSLLDGGGPAIYGENIQGAFLGDLTVQGAEPGLELVDATDVVVDGVVAQDSDGAGMLFTRTQDLTLRQVQVIDSGVDCLDFDQPTGRILLEDVVTRSCGDNGIEWHQDGGDFDLQIRRSTFEDVDEGIHLHINGDSTDRITMALEDVTILGLDGGDGIQLDLDGQRGAATPALLSLDHVDIAGFRQRGLQLDIQNDARIRVDMVDGDLVGGDGASTGESGVELDTKQDASATLSVTGTHMTRIDRGIDIAPGTTGSTTVLATNLTIHATDAGLHTSAASDGVVQITLDGSTLTGPDAIDITARSQNVCRLTIADTDAEGVWRMTQQSGAEFSLTAPALAGAVFSDDDGGILAAAGNTTEGGTPVVVVRGDITAWDPALSSLP